MKRLSLVAGAVLSIATLAASPATAGLLGDSIQGAYDFPCDTCLYDLFSYSVNPFTVGAGVDSILNVDIINDINVDFSDNALVLTFQEDVGWNPASFNGPEFTVLSGNPFGSI